MNSRRNHTRPGRGSNNYGRSTADEGVARYRRNAYGTPGYDAPAAAYGSPEYPAGVAPAPRRVSRGEYDRARKRKRNRVIAIVVTVALVLVLGGAGAAFAYFSKISSNLHEGVDSNLLDSLVDAPQPTDPFYILLMGTDGSSERAASAEYAGDNFRSDSIILTRVDPTNKKVTMVSLHRDTLINMGEYGQNKLNAAHAIGGPAMTVDVVSELAGVPISHYAEINFDGFKDIVDALGGVEVDVPIEINDDDAGGHLDAGVQTLNGDQALILCRSRHAYDEYGDGDTYRAANQRLVLAAIAKKILAADVGTMVSTVEALSQYVTTDLEITEIVGLAQSMRGLDADSDIYSAMEPTESQYLNDVWYEITLQNEWKTMMQRVDQGLPPTTEDVVDEASGTLLASTGGNSGANSSKSGSTGGLNARASKTYSGSVTIKNGNGISGAGSEAEGRIEPLGFTVESSNADSFDYPQTLIVYELSSQAEEAQAIASALGVGATFLNDGTYAYEGDFLVVLGNDWE